MFANCSFNQIVFELGVGRNSPAKYYFAYVLLTVVIEDKRDIQLFKVCGSTQTVIVHMILT